MYCVWFIRYYWNYWLNCVYKLVIHILHWGLIQYIDNVYWRRNRGGGVIFKYCKFPIPVCVLINVTLNLSMIITCVNETQHWKLTENNLYNWYTVVNVLQSNTCMHLVWPPCALMHHWHMLWTNLTKNC